MKKNSVKSKVVGREREQKILNDLFESGKSEFIAVYGRRRIGKTYLIKNFVDSTPSVFFHVTGLQKGTSKEQLQEFAKQIGVTFYQGASISSRSNWRDAFEDLSQAISKASKEKKIVLFFDELPWMATPRSKLLTALELYWNRYWVFDHRIKLIICGSATSWIIENIINNKGGLHNRVTRTIQIKPFLLHEAEKYLLEKKIKLTRRQILDLYIVIGGVPYYWSFIRKGHSASQNIDEICFQRDGPLIKEFSRIFGSLFEDERPYIELIRIISKHRYGIKQADLIGESKLPDGGSTVKKLHQLEEAGFIISLMPYGHKEKGIYYLMDDEYCLFYLNWIEPNIRSISKKSTNQGYWMSKSNTPSWKIWSGLSFESVCYKHIDQIRAGLNIDPGSTVGTWRYSPRTKEEKGAQIDLLFDRPDGVISICEIKNSNEHFPIDKKYAKELLEKMEIFKKHFKTSKQLFLSMIRTLGLKKTMYSEEIVDSEVTLEDLFKE